MLKHSLLLGLALLSQFVARLPAEEQEGLEFFEKKIRPVLVKHCYECHSQDSKEVKGGLLLDTREGIRTGGESGHAVVPGNLKESLILDALRYEGLEMPPKQQLPTDVIADFEAWIQMGAPDPREGQNTLIKRVIDFEKSKQFWSYQPITKPNLPLVQNTAWSRSEIDRFVLAKLEEKGLQPVNDADPEKLVRRIYFDLIGLPPTPQQLQKFLKDTSPDRVEALIDELLDSPQFGERWGRHWLDVVRYAESCGMERDYTFPHAWRYRDYVVEAFNRDLPFDQFITEQIAGDLLPASTPEDKQRQTIATTLLAIGPLSLNERNREQFAMDIVDHQIDVTTRAFLGLTASCARCHDHKFDAIPQSEYYALAGIFRSTQTFYGTGGGNGNRQQGSLLAMNGEKVTPTQIAASGNKKAAKGKQNLRQLRRRLNKLQQGTPNAKQKRQIANLKAKIAALRNSPEEEENEAGPPKGAVLTMGVLDASNPANTPLRIRGEVNDRGEMVQRGVLTIATLGEFPSIEPNQSGRLEYARWIASSENPLTSRVAVNRIWQHLFGRGIVEGVNNFGENGDLPTHPELLDYLAADFMQHGWSMKHTIKTIMLSRVYQLGSLPNPQAEEMDPDNTLLWKMNHRRLEAEAIRDAMLTASGNLDLKPEQSSLVARLGDGNVGQGIRPEVFNSPSNKRSVYLPIVRSALPEMLRIFDFPEPSIIGGQREVTTVPTQALYMMNSEFVLTQSKNLAEDLLAQDLSPEARVQQAYLRTLSRNPTAPEIRRVLAFLEEAAPMAKENISSENLEELQLWTAVCQSLLASAEFRYLE